jgi:hypothetical protein
MKSDLKALKPSKQFYFQSATLHTDKKKHKNPLTSAGIPVQVSDVELSHVLFAIQKIFAKPPKDKSALPQRQLEVLVYAVGHGVFVEEPRPRRRMLFELLSFFIVKFYLFLQFLPESIEPAISIGHFRCPLALPGRHQ